MLPRRAACWPGLVLVPNRTPHGRSRNRSYFPVFYFTNRSGILVNKVCHRKVDHRRFFTPSRCCANAPSTSFPSMCAPRSEGPDTQGVAPGPSPWAPGHRQPASCLRGVAFSGRCTCTRRAPACPGVWRLPPRSEMDAACAGASLLSTAAWRSAVRVRRVYVKVAGAAGSGLPGPGREAGQRWGRGDLTQRQDTAETLETTTRSLPIARAHPQGSSSFPWTRGSQPPL